MSEGDKVDAADQLLLACQNGDAHSLQAMMSSVAGLDLSMATEDGVTLLMHAIIGAGEAQCTVWTLYHATKGRSNSNFNCMRAFSNLCIP